jgi:hypothetical protein
MPPPSSGQYIYYRLPVVVETERENGDYRAAAATRSASSFWLMA